ncbi:MAG: bifunctional enoyl-CoA hydratase/phosphate acetyltransferase [Acidiferrobacteraceae bacterium]|nr:bifunctional enoyl-CoA hydratase/phosphate acetyltransferase [Acidiferrobacteraceae bacterium]
MKSLLSQREVQCPRSLLKRAASAEPVMTAIIGAGHPLVLESAREAQNAGIIQPLLVGDAKAIGQAAKEIGWDIEDLQIVEGASEERSAKEGAALARSGAVQMVMKGHIHSDTFMRPLLAKDTGIRGKQRLSHVFHMTLPDTDEAIMLTDCAVNVAPNIPTRLAIIENAVALAHKLGQQRPRVALLGASETVSDAMPVTGQCQEITAHFGATNLQADVYGPLAFDNIVSVAAARMKGIEHPVAGNADIVVVPTIEAGNALFKMMVYLMSACAAGIVLGGSVPVLLTSRADPPAARLASAALGAIAGR